MYLHFTFDDSEQAAGDSYFARPVLHNVLKIQDEVSGEGTKNQDNGIDIAKVSSNVRALYFGDHIYVSVHLQNPSQFNAFGDCKMTAWHIATVTKVELFHHVTATKSYLHFDNFTGDVVFCSTYFFLKLFFQCLFLL